MELIQDKIDADCESVLNSYTQEYTYENIEDLYDYLYENFDYKKKKLLSYKESIEYKADYDIEITMFDKVFSYKLGSNEDTYLNYYRPMMIDIENKEDVFEHVFELFAKYIYIKYTGKSFIKSNKNVERAGELFTEVLRDMALTDTELKNLTSRFSSYYVE